MYKLLGVPPEASLDEIKKAYFSLAKRYHPDIDQSADASQKFQAVQNAYEILSNQAKRSIYDETGNFVDLESKAMKANQEGLIRPPGGLKWYKTYKHPQTYYDLKRQNLGENIQFDIKIELEVSFIEALAGFTKVVKYLREEICAVCAGNGCQICRDSGHVMRYMDAMVDCNPLDDRKVIHFAEMGHFQQKTGTFADLYVTIKTQPHPIFTVKKEESSKNGVVWNIHSDHYLTISEAILGCKINVYTIHGQKEVEVPPATHHGHTICLKGLGPRAPKIGDHIVNFKIDVPERLNKQQERLLKEFWTEYTKVTSQHL